MPNDETPTPGAAGFRWLAPLSLQRRLMLIILIPTGMALVLASVGMYGYQRYALTHTLGGQLASLASTICANVRAAVSFKDKAQTVRVLSSLAETPNIVTAVIYERDGTVLASHVRGREGGAPVVKPLSSVPVRDGTWTTAETLSISRPIYNKQEELGRLVITSDLGLITKGLDDLRGYCAAGVPVLLVLAFFLSALLQRSISRPILDLSETALRVSRSRDYSARAVKWTDDELGQLTDRFNEMLATIEDNLTNLEVLARQKAEAERKSAQQQEVTRLLESHIDAISRAGQGDLRVVFREGGTEELTILSRYLNTMIGQISTLIGQMQGTVQRLTATVAEIETNVGQQTENIMRHSEVASVSCELIDGLKETALSMATQAAQVVRTAASSSRQFENGEQSLQTTVRTMERMGEASQSSAAKMKNLMQHLDRVEDILSTVNDLAEQSKLLALNAAIEAARAGVLGKGFSVVAMEVRSLALQSKDASSQIKRIIQGIRQASEVVSAAFNLAQGEIREGLAQMSALHAIHGQLRATLDEFRSLTVLVETSSSNQLKKTDDIARAIQENVQRMEQNLESNRTVQNAMAGLSDLARALAMTVSLFKSEKSDEWSGSIVMPRSTAVLRERGDRPGGRPA